MKSIRISSARLFHKVWVQKQRLWRSDKSDNGLIAHHHIYGTPLPEESRIERQSASAIDGVWVNSGLHQTREWHKATPSLSRTTLSHFQRGMSRNRI
jgi:hypothetical protein